MENTLNPQALALTKAIKQHESGGKYDIKGASQEYGAYQWTPDTWKAQAKEVLGDANADITNPTLQNKVAYSIIEKDLKSGLSPAEVSAKWNSGQAKGWENKISTGFGGKLPPNKFGVEFNVPAYVNSVGQLYTQELQKTKQSQPQETPNQQTSQFNPAFPSSPQDTPLQAGLKTAGNIIPSALNFAKNTFQAINPINTIENIEKIGSQFSALSQEQGGALNALGQTAKALPQSLYEGVVPTAGRELIKAGYQGITGQDNTQALQNAQQAITEDPFGQIAPFVIGARQLAEKAGVVQQFDDFIKKGVDATLKPIITPANFVAEKASQVARGGVAQATGLNPETVKALIDNPELYTKTARQNLNRSAIANKVGTALDDLESQVSDTGAGYNAIRENTGVTYIAPTFLSEALKPFNIKVQNGKIVTSAESTPLSTADITQLQKFVDDYGNERFLTNNAFLNARTALSDMSKYDAQKTGRLQNVARTLRQAYDAIGKEKIEGLKNLDEEFAPLKQQFEALKKDYLTKENGEYVFKQGAVTKLANLDKVGRERVLGRLEQLVPDIGKEIKMLKVVEDIERASGIKVGTYGKGALLGAGLLSGGVVGAIISAILTSPEIAVPLIRGYGLTKNQTAQVLMNLRLMLGETKQSGMDLLQKEIPVEDMVNALTGKGIPNRQGGFIKNPLAENYKNLDWNKIPESGVTETIPLNKIKVDQDSFNTALKNVKRGDGSRTSGQVEVVMLKDGTFAIEDGHHRTIQKMLQGDKDIKATVYSSKDLYNENKYSTYNKVFDNKNPLSQSDNLIQEAKKYKSAEEFIKKQPIVYHGTSANLKKFDNKRGTFFTDDYMNADGYASGNNVYEGYINLKKPLIIDAKGKLYNDLKTEYGKSTNEIVGKVDQSKYDGIIFKNIKDSFVDDAEVQDPMTIYYAFKPRDSFLNQSQLEDIWKQANK